MRLLVLGFVILTAGLTAGFFVGRPVAGLKFWVSVAVWSAYGVILLLRGMHFLPPRRAAVLSVAVFALALLTLPVVETLSVVPKS